jgi:hypothetical protein
MTTTPSPTPVFETPTAGATDPTAPAAEDSTAPADNTPAGFAVGDLITYTTQAPWGSQTQTGRVVAVGTPEGASRPQVQIEWVTVTGPIDASAVEAYTPAV